MSFIDRKWVRDVLDTLGDHGVVNRQDASEGIAVARELEHVRAGVLEVVYPDLKAFEFLPMDTSVGPTDEAWLAQKFDMVGSAALGADYADNAPTADAFITEETPTFIRPIKGRYEYSFQEARVAAKLGRPLPQYKANACRRAIREVLDDVLLLGAGGAAHYGLFGLFKLTGTATYTVPNGVSGLKTWANKTPKEVLLDLNQPITESVIDTKEKGIPTRLILPVSSLEYIRTTRMGIDSDTTILQAFLRNSPHVQDVRSSIKLETAGAGGTKRFVLYRAMNDVVEAAVPVEFEQLPTTVEGYHLVTRCHARIGGVKAWQPKMVKYGDGI